MMAHVWNEIEHDLGYKPFPGSLSPFERDQLNHLSVMVRIANGIISQLLAATGQRLGAATTPFARSSTTSSAASRGSPNLGNTLEPETSDRLLIAPAQDGSHLRPRPVQQGARGDADPRPRRGLLEDAGQG